MHNVKTVAKDLYWVGGSDRRLSLFEGVYSVPDGVSYNSYLLLDGKTVLFDTVDSAVSKVFFENLSYMLEGRQLDFLILQHMEPDHSATLGELLLRHPETTVVCNQKSKTMAEQFFRGIDSGKFLVVKEGDTLDSGSHKLTFIMAPMVH